MVGAGIKIAQVSLVRLAKGGLAENLVIISLIMKTATPFSAYLVE
jgi:hypothetical protein